MTITLIVVVMTNHHLQCFTLIHCGRERIPTRWCYKHCGANLIVITCVHILCVISVCDKYNVKCKAIATTVKSNINGDTFSLSSSHCFACLFLSFTLLLANLYEVSLLKYEGDSKGLKPCLSGKGLKPCLSFFISFSLFYIRTYVCHILFFVQASLPSLHRPLYIHYSPF